MDSLSSTIAALRIALANANALAAAVEAAVATVPVAPPVALPMPAPIQHQRAVGVATPATFGDAEANAEHYLLGKSLYVPSKALKDAAEEARLRYFEAHCANSAHAIQPAANQAMQEARGKWCEARWALNGEQSFYTRYQAYYDGCWASTWQKDLKQNMRCFIYRFFVFEELVSGPFTGTMAAHWKPIGLLNPHAYIANKKARNWRKTFLDFVDASQPAPDVTAYWRAKISAAHAPTLQRQNAIGGSALSTPAGEAPVAIAPIPVAAGPRMAYPTLERVAGTTDILESAVLGPKAMAFESELKALDAVRITGPIDWALFERLNRAYHGGWTTLPDGRKAMLWAFHAFAPPADGSYRTQQPLVHLGLYSPNDRSLDVSEAPPALPKDKADWPF